MVITILLIVLSNNSVYFTFGIIYLAMSYPLLCRYDSLQNKFITIVCHITILQSPQHYYISYWCFILPISFQYHIISFYRIFFIIISIMISRLIWRNIGKFSLDHSNLSSSITSQADRNYKITLPNPIDGFITSNHTNNPHTVIMIHQWWGFNLSITKTAQIFSNNQIRVFVPDLYRAKPAKDAQEAGHKMSGLDWPNAIKDIKLIKQHFDKLSKSVSIMGFCMGGALALASASAIGGWKVAAPFYGIPDLNIFRLDKIKCKVFNNLKEVIGHFGRTDPLIGFSDAETAQKLGKQAKENKYPIQIKIWQGASHAFCNQDSKYFNKKSRDQSFQLTRKYILENI